VHSKTLPSAYLLLAMLLVISLDRPIDGNDESIASLFQVM
jgi:hypothetical protein